MNPQALYWLNGSWQSLEVENAENLDNLDSTDFSLANHKHFKSDITDLPKNATTAQDGFMSAADKTKLDNIATNANNYSHPTTSGNKHIPSGGSSGQILRWSADGTAVWGADNNTTYSVATTTSNGLMSSTDKSKLDNIATNANNYVHPSTHDASMITESATKRFVSDTEKNTWNAKASTSVATVSTNGLMSASDKAKLDGISAGAGNYVHPTSDGYKHVPANGTTNSGKYLQATATAGTYQWATLPTASTTTSGIVQLNDTVTSTSTTLGATANAVKQAYDKASHSHPYAASSHTHTKSQITDFPTSLPANGGNAATVNGKTVESNVPANAVFTDTTYGVASTSANGLMSTAMVTKLNGIATNANNYVHPTTAGNKHIPSGGSTGQILKWSASGTAVWADLQSGGAANIKDGSSEGSIISTCPIPGMDFPVGVYSFALGRYAHATHDDAVAIGNGAMATNSGAVAIGSSTQASGNCSFAEGSQTTSSGQCSHAEGAASQATEYCAHAEGWNTRATGMRSHAEGQATQATKGNAHAEGKETQASGENSHAEGYASRASAENSHAEGESTVAFGYCSHAEGYNTTASGSYSHAEGYYTRASLSYTHAEGYRTWANNTGSHAEGYYCQGYGQCSHAEGQYTTSFGKASHSEGYSSNLASVSTTPTYNPSSAYSSWNNAKGSNASAYSIAYGDSSHVEGENSGAFGYYSHAEGLKTAAYGNASHSEGNQTYAKGDYSNARGFATTANTWGVNVQGRYNKVSSGYSSSYSSTQDAFVIGNGSSTSSLSNAFRVTYDGKTYGLSAFNSTGADYAEYFEWLDGNPENEDRIGHFVTLDGNKIKIAESEEDYIVGIISGNQSVIGNACEDEWDKMYIRDEFDRLQYEDIEVEQEEHIYNEETEEVEVVMKKVTENVIKLNPDYNSKMKYIPRSQRKEWGIVGMLGQIKVRDDGTCKVNSYCKPSKNGIATHSDDKSHYRVIERVNDHIVKVVFK